MNSLFHIIFAIVFVWGVLDLYMCYRFVRKPEVDSTAGVLWYLVAKWNFASQTEAFVKKFPWISKDLTEAFGNEEDDDGKIT